MPMSSRRRSGTAHDGMASAYADQAIDLRDSVPFTEQDLAMPRAPLRRPSPRGWMASPPPEACTPTACSNLP
jgi:hypothetical protein